MEILILPDLEAISTEAARLFTILSDERIRSSGRFSAALSGGITPKRLYQILATEQYRKKIEWGKLHIFWVDERCVPSDHHESNYRLIHDNLLSDIPIPSENIHRINTGSASPAHAAHAYEAEMKSFFGVSDAEPYPIFDLIILGIGKDGHTASLFPGSRTRSEKNRLAVAVRTRTIRRQRITLTLPVLNSAKNIIFLVSGNNKASVMDNIVMKGDKRLPASLVHPVHGRCLFLLDREAGRYILEVEVKENVQ